MAVVNCYFSVKCASTPISEDSPTPPPIRNPLPTKIILPNKKPEKWSTGVAPGEYGGPPMTTKLRKYWGGEGEDPLTSDEFIWNKDFMGRMKRLFPDPVDSSKLQSSPTPKEESSGFLSLNRVMDLDSLENDLSKQLTAPTKPVKERQPWLAQPSGIVSRKWRPAPTRREQDKWSRAAKSATGGTDAMLREVDRPRGDPRVLAAQSREQYFKLKNKMQELTVGVGAVGLVSAYLSYSPEIAASYGAGLLGSLAYVRMLGSSVDSMADGARGLMKGAISQPRLLIPVALVMIYNRWNGLLVPDYGLFHLQLIPMLLGFFTYKIANFIQAIEEAMKVFETNTEV